MKDGMLHALRTHWLPRENGPGGAIAAILLALHLLVVVLVPLAHAREHAESLYHSVHIESPKERPCSPPHALAVCHMFRALASDFTAPARAIPRLSEPGVARQASPASDPLLDLPAYGSALGSRAPPLA